MYIDMAHGTYQVDISYSQKPRDFYRRILPRGFGGSIFAMNDFSDNVGLEKTSSFEEYATHGSWVVTKIPSCGIPEVSMASPMTFSVPNLNPVSFNDMVFSMAGGLTMHISGFWKETRGQLD